MYGKGGRLRDLDNSDINNSKSNAVRDTLIISEKCEITVNQKIKDTEGTYILRLKNRFIASNYGPGQFVMIKINNGDNGFDPLLSRPFSIFNKFNENEFEVLYRVCGRGTGILSKIPKGNF
jgi:2-polyprenylphenol hydroxylase and related flavodoxin oxidoreductases